MKFNLIIEGANCTGKTSSMNILRKIFSDATVVEYHDFYYEHIKNQLGIERLIEKDDWLKIGRDDKKKIESYLDKRFLASIDFANQLTNNIVIFERLALTRLVYSKIIFEEDNSNLIELIDNNLYENNFIIILLTNPDKNELKYRLSRKFKERESQLGRQQFHLRDIEMGIYKDKLFLEYFEKFKKTKKHIILNSGTGDKRVADLAKKLKEVIKDYH